MTENHENTTDPALGGAQPEPTAAVIARPNRHTGDRSWQGRYLHHAPGPSATARLIRDTVTARSTVRTRLSAGRSELIDEHPCGWEHLGARTAKDPEIKARRRPAAAGACYCHTPDGQLRPAYLEQLLGLLDRAEQAPVYSGEEFKKVMPRSADPTDSVPCLMGSFQNLPDRVAYAFILRAESITIAVRHGASPCEYLKAGEIDWSGEADWEQIDATAAAIRARTTEDQHPARARARGRTRPRRRPAHHGTPRPPAPPRARRPSPPAQPGSAPDEPRGTPGPLSAPVAPPARADTRRSMERARQQRTYRS